MGHAAARKRRFDRHYQEVAPQFKASNALASGADPQTGGAQAILG
jgi:hypothetical protein